MNAKEVCAVVFTVVFLVIFIVIVVPRGGPWPTLAPLAAEVGPALWKGRTYEVVLQGVIILAGVLSILLLLGRNRLGRMQP
jgi:hypothetical protein